MSIVTEQKVARLEAEVAALKERLASLEALVRSAGHPHTTAAVTRERLTLKSKPSG